MADPYSFILTESHLSNSQEEVLKRIPGWDERDSLLPPSQSQATQRGLQSLSATDEDTDEDNPDYEDSRITASHLPSTLQFASPDSQLHVDNDSYDHALESDRSTTPSPKRTWDPFHDSFAARIITQSQGEPGATALKVIAMETTWGDDTNNATNNNVDNLRGHQKEHNEHVHITTEDMECVKEDVNMAMEGVECVKENVEITSEDQVTVGTKDGTKHLTELRHGSCIPRDASKTQGFDRIIKEEVVEEQQDVLTKPAETFRRGMHLKTPKSEPLLNVSTQNVEHLATDLQTRIGEENISAETPQSVFKQYKLLEYNLNDCQVKVKEESSIAKNVCSSVKRDMHGNKKVVEETHVTNLSSNMHNQKDCNNLLIIQDRDPGMACAASDSELTSVNKAQGVLPKPTKDHNLVKIFPDTLMDAVIQSSRSLPFPQPNDPDLLTVFMRTGVDLDLSYRDCRGQCINRKRL